MSIGIKNHPAIRCRIEQVKSWFDLLESPGLDLVETYKAFAIAKREVMKDIDTRWLRVKGPMGAIIATLHDVGWGRAVCANGLVVEWSGSTSLGWTHLS